MGLYEHGSQKVGTAGAPAAGPKPGQGPSRRCGAQSGEGLAWKPGAGDRTAGKSLSPRGGQPEAWVASPHLDGGRGHLASLVKIQGEDLGEARGIAVHDRGAVPEGFQECKQSLPLLHCRTQAGGQCSPGMESWEQLRPGLPGDRWPGDGGARQRRSWCPGASRLPTPFSPICSLLSCPCLTRKHLVPAARNGGQVLHQVLAVGGLATATAAQQDDGLILSAHQHRPVCSLGHSIDVGCHVLSPTPLEHVHHLCAGEGDGTGRLSSSPSRTTLQT